MTRNRLPTYSLHKATGQARVWLNGKDHYLGTYGSEESRLRYAELIKAHATGVAVDPLAADGTQDDGLSVNELVQAYLTFAARHYQKNGSITAEVHCVRSAVRPLVNLFGDTPAKKFGPAALNAVRQSMIDSGSMCRDFINKSVGRIRRVFKYAVENELIPASVLTGLQALSPLLAGRMRKITHHEQPFSTITLSLCEATSMNRRGT